MLSERFPGYAWDAQLWDYDTGAAVAAHTPDGRRHGAWADEVGPKVPDAVWLELGHHVVNKLSEVA